jgi:enoyl-CoA hydratase/carnithine racemase
MAADWEAPEDILVYYSGTSELSSPQPYKLVKTLYQHAGNGVFVITLNDPKTLNSMSLQLAQELPLLIEHVKRDERCKVVVWTGTGRAFSAGGNFTDPTSTVPEDVFEGYVHAGLAVALPDIAAAGATRAMIKFPKLSIAAVNGIAVGGGVNMAFVWHDLCFSAETATFRYPFGQLGLTPELGSSTLMPRIIGLPRAKQLLMLGKEFSAQTAHEFGLCNEVLPSADAAVSRALEVAKSLASMPQFALRQSKRLMNQDLIDRIDHITEDENETIKKAFVHPETMQAMAALRKKTSKL